MRGFDLRVGLQLETQPGMAGAHDAVRDEARGVADMAAYAQHGARLRLVGRIQPVLGHQVGMPDQPGGVRPQPALAAAMARLAADAVLYAELHAAQRLRHVVGVALQALLCVLGRADAEVRGDAPAERALQIGVGVGVLVLALPDQVLVLHHGGMLLGARRHAMACRTRTTGHAQMRVRRRLQVSAGRHAQPEREQDQAWYGQCASKR